MRPLALTFTLSLLLLASCQYSEADCPEAPADFDGHIQRWFDHEEDLAAYCQTRLGDGACKFLIPVFAPERFDPRHVRHAHKRGGVEFMDPAFYTLHDEWWWFHLLNGAPIDGCPRQPLSGQKRYQTIAEVYDDFSRFEHLPLGMGWSGDRLYSTEFYMYMLSACFECGYKVACWNTCPRVMAGGTLMYYPPDPKRPVPESFWAFKLYRDDAVKAWEVARFFERLRPALPTDVAAGLRWLARPQEMQEVVVDAMRAEGGPLADRLLKMADVVTPGQVTIYNPGYAVGWIRRVADGELGKASFKPTDIAVLQTVPEDMPPVAAILTAEPQTAQAHLNLLAKARGTPNGFTAGAYDDATLKNWETEQQMLAVRMTDGLLAWLPLTWAQANAYNKLVSEGEVTVKVPLAELEGAPETVDLSASVTSQFGQSVALVGGKSAGMAALFSRAAMAKPFRPLAITVAGYARHLEGLKPTINAMLNSGAFISSGYARFALLEGRAAFEAANAGDPAAEAWLKKWTKDLLQLPKVLRDTYSQGGLVQLIRNRTLDPPWAAQIDATLKSHFADLSLKQGLRFRSSATAEDIEGFNGAGIYASYTGWLDPIAAGKSKSATAARAIKRTWASYWSYAAFSEREAAGIDHLTGRMAVLVHPRFDELFEAANGVLLVKLVRQLDGSRLLITEVDAQHGSISVTNPERVGAQAEVDHIVQTPGEAPTIERVQLSNQVTVGVQILSDAELLTMHNEAVALAQTWLAHLNAPLPLAERRLTLQLDLEFRRVHPGWPVMTSGAVQPSRLVYKQARTLMPTFGLSVGELGGLQAPADLIAASVNVQTRACKASGFEFEASEFLTSPAVSVFAHAKTPFVGRIRLKLAAGLPGGLPAKKWHQASHVALAHFKHLQSGSAGYGVEVVLTDAQALAWGWRKLVIEADGDWRIDGDAATLTGGGGVTCTATPVKLSVDGWVASLFE